LSKNRLMIGGAQPIELSIKARRLPASSPHGPAPGRPEEGTPHGSFIRVLRRAFFMATREAERRYPMKTSLRLLAAIAALSAVTFARAEIKARGSDSTLHVVKALAAAFTADTGKSVAIEGGGSGAGAKGAIAGEITLAFLSRDLNAAEKTGGLVGYAYAKDGVAVIVHKDNTVAGLSVAELKDLFTGKTASWADGKPVVAFNRNADSGTREVFQEHVLGKDAFSPKAAVKHDGVLIGSVEKIASAVAFTSLGEADESKVRIVPIAGVKPTVATLKDGTYPIVRTPTLATKGEAAGDEKAFIDFVLGPKGQAIVTKEGLVALK
jgi:phosphate transport system substrate-binding protein